MGRQQGVIVLAKERSEEPAKDFVGGPFFTFILLKISKVTREQNHIENFTQPTIRQIAISSHFYMLNNKNPTQK